MYAASSNSFGKLMKNCRKIKIYKPPFRPYPNIHGIKIGFMELVHPNTLLYKMKDGIIITCNGITIANTSIPNNRLLPLKWNLANPYPINEQDITWIKVATAVMYSELGSVTGPLNSCHAYL
jgi:hypothetical protein